MAIYATNTSKPRELIPPGNYIARCYQMIHIGHVTEIIKGKNEYLNKARLGWELPTEQRVFKPELGPQPLVISKDFILKLGPQTNLRKVIDSWRGVPLNDDQAKKFDMTTLIGAYCFLNIIHQQAKNGNTYEEISAITPVVKGMSLPAAITPNFILSYDAWDAAKFETLPPFIKDKMKTSDEYKHQHGLPTSPEWKALLAQAKKNTPVQDPTDFSKMHELAAKNAAVTAGDDLPF